MNGQPAIVANIPIPLERRVKNRKKTSSLVSSRKIIFCVARHDCCVIRRHLVQERKIFVFPVPFRVFPASISARERLRRSSCRMNLQKSPVAGIRNGFRCFASLSSNWGRRSSWRESFWQSRFTRPITIRRCGASSNFSGGWASSLPASGRPSSSMPKRRIRNLSAGGRGIPSIPASRELRTRTIFPGASNRRVISLLQSRHGSRSWVGRKTGPHRFHAKASGS